MRKRWWRRAGIKRIVEPEYKNDKMQEGILEAFSHHTSWTLAQLQLSQPVSIFSLLLRFTLRFTQESGAVFGFLSFIKTLSDFSAGCTDALSVHVPLWAGITFTEPFSTPGISSIDPYNSVLGSVFHCLSLSVYPFFFVHLSLFLYLCLSHFHSISISLCLSLDMSHPSCLSVSVSPFLSFCLTVWQHSLSLTPSFCDSVAALIMASVCGCAVQCRRT